MVTSMVNLQRMIGRNAHNNRDSCHNCNVKAFASKAHGFKLVQNAGTSLLITQIMHLTKMNKMVSLHTFYQITFFFVIRIIEIYSFYSKRGNSPLSFFVMLFIKL